MDLPAELIFLLFEACIETAPEALANLARTCRPFFAIYKANKAKFVEKAARGYIGEYFQTALFLGLIYGDANSYKHIRHYQASDKFRFNISSVTNLEMRNPTGKMYEDAIWMHSQMLFLAETYMMAKRKKEMDNLSYAKRIDVLRANKWIDGAYTYALRFDWHTKPNRSNLTFHNMVIFPWDIQWRSLYGPYLWEARKKYRDICRRRSAKINEYLAERLFGPFNDTQNAQSAGLIQKARDSMKTSTSSGPRRLEVIDNWETLCYATKRELKYKYRISGGFLGALALAKAAKRYDDSGKKDSGFRACVEDRIEFYAHQPNVFLAPSFK